MININSETICVVCIAKDEEKFLDEWLIYHKLIGVNKFFIYDDNVSKGLDQLLAYHGDYVTVIPWERSQIDFGPMNQIAAYQHAKENYISDFEWVIFMDVDEFIVLKEHTTVLDFLSCFPLASAVSLNWHIFGHNGYYYDPEGLITSSLTRRMAAPSNRVKTFSRVKDIKQITSPHSCKLKREVRVDANNKPYSDSIYTGKSKIAHINHYQCRSFSRWVNRAERGDVNFNFTFCPPEHSWRLTYESCLKQFVTTVALNKNEKVDDHMIKFKEAIDEGIVKLRLTQTLSNVMVKQEKNVD